MTQLLCCLPLLRCGCEPSAVCNSSYCSNTRGVTSREPAQIPTANSVLNLPPPPLRKSKREKKLKPLSLLLHRKPLLGACEQTEILIKFKRGISQSCLSRKSYSDSIPTNSIPTVPSLLSHREGLRAPKLQLTSSVDFYSFKEKKKNSWNKEEKYCTGCTKWTWKFCKPLGNVSTKNERSVSASNVVEYRAQWSSKCRQKTKMNTCHCTDSFSFTKHVMSKMYSEGDS